MVCYIASALSTLNHLDLHVPFAADAGRKHIENELAENTAYNNGFPEEIMPTMFYPDYLSPN